MAAYNAFQHQLLCDIAHRNALTPKEFPEFQTAVINAGVLVFDVAMPAGGVPYSDMEWWTGFGDVWWVKLTWEGVQPVIADGDTRQALGIAREMAGSKWDPIRNAYIWNCEIFDPEIHFPLREWLAENHLGFMDFLRRVLPVMRQRTGRDDCLVTTTNPGSDTGRSRDFSAGILRCVRLTDKPILDEYLAPQQSVSDSPQTDSDGPVVLDGIRFDRRGVFYVVDSELPAIFHRASGHSLVLREPREVRFFGDSEIARRGLVINGYPVESIETWQNGWHGYFRDDVDVAQVAKDNL